jgi:3-hydroxymyristoyl/3-hydroxydecanoyl-(acyl carrier protein) dehydratase
MKLPALLTIDSPKMDEVVLDIDTSIESGVFDGHFPGNPILPGVAQIDWAIRFATLHLGINVPVAREFQVKFSNIIHPNDPVSLTLQLDRSKDRLLFTYKSGDAIMSSGRIRLRPEA